MSMSAYLSRNLARLESEGVRLTVSFIRILVALDTHGSMNADEIAETAAVGKETLSGGRYMAKLVELGLVRVSKWERQLTSGPFRPVYSVRPGKHAEKPKPYTNAEKSRRWRQRSGYTKAEREARRVAKNSLIALLSITSKGATPWKRNSSTQP
jgi:hypothetical protein